MIYLANILISAAVGIMATLAAYNYLPLSFIEKFGPKSETIFGATITTIAGTDTIRDSRTTINNNFTNLNNDKIEVATTSIGNITSLPNLVSIGTITTGVWNGTAIPVAYGGMGTTSPAIYQVMLGNAARGLTIASSTGTSGQFFTSNGAGAYPSWTTSSVDQALNYTWTGSHIFTRATTTNATTTTLYSQSAVIASSTIASTTVGALNATSSITTRGDLTVFGTVSSKGTATSTYAGGISVTSGCFQALNGKCVFGAYEKVTATATGPDVDDETIDVTASCSTGKNVIGGGGSTGDTAGPDMHVTYKSEPTANNDGWIFGATCFSTTGATCTGGTQTAWAICVNQ